jgi:hypothetical protein
MATLNKQIEALMRFYGPNPVPGGIYPHGKGMFLWICDRIGNAQEIASKAKAAGLDWVAIKVQNGRLLTDGQKDEFYFLQLQIEEVFSALRAEGIKAFGWGYVYLNSDDQVLHEIATTVDAIRHYGCDGWIINAEQEAKGQHKRASRYLGYLRQYLGEDYAIGFTSYRYPSLHRTFPWKPFFDACDYAVPQVYWLLASNPAEQLVKTVGEYSNADLTGGRTDMPVIPAGCAYPHGSWKPTPAQMDAFYCKLRELNLKAWTWWEWYYAEKQPEWWKTITRQHSEFVTQMPSVDEDDELALELAASNEAYQRLANAVGGLELVVETEVEEGLTYVLDTVSEVLVELKVVVDNLKKALKLYREKR